MRFGVIICVVVAFRFQDLWRFSLHYYFFATNTRMKFGVIICVLVAFLFQDLWSFGLHYDVFATNTMNIV